jgi:hypothetical protein
VAMLNTLLLYRRKIAEMRRNAQINSGMVGPCLGGAVGTRVTTIPGGVGTVQNLEFEGLDLSDHVCD